MSAQDMVEKDIPAIPVTVKVSELLTDEAKFFGPEQAQRC
jgi:hypothetical protein